MRLVLAAAVAAGVLAGCGEDDDGESLSKAEYLAHVRSIQEGAQPADRLYFGLVTGDSLSVSACGKKAAEFHRELERILGEIEALDPPDDIAGLQRDFVAAIRESVASVGRTSEDAAAGTVRCGSDINWRIYGLPSTGRAERTLERIEQRGYVIRGD